MGNNLIKTIEVTNFKSIEHTELELSPLNVLIGANGAGKTNFLEVFKLIQHTASSVSPLPINTIKGSIDAEDIFPFGEIDRKLGITIHVPEKISMDFSTVGNGAIKAEPITWGKGQSEALKKIEMYDFSNMKAARNRSRVEDNLRLHSDGSNLAAFLYRLKENSALHWYYEKIKDRVNLCYPMFKDFIFTELPASGVVYMEWQSVFSDKVFCSSLLSDATMRCIGLVTVFNQPELPNLIVIDNPDLGLHSAVIYILGGMLNSISPETQVIISTQSIDMLNNIYHCNKIVSEGDFKELVDKVQTGLVVVENDLQTNYRSCLRHPNRNTLATWLIEYNMGELWEKNILGGRP